MAVLKETFFLKFIFLSIILFPILSIYGSGIPGWSIATVLNLGIALLTIPRFNISKDLKIMPKWVYILFIDAIIVYYLSSNPSYLPLSEIQTFLLFLVAFYYVRPSNLQLFIHLYKNTALACLIFFFFQTFSYHVLDIKVSGILHFLPLTINDVDWVSFHDSSVRFSSFFSEPAHFVYFLMPLICLEMYKNNKNWLLISLLSLAIIISTSGTGILVLAVMIAFWFIWNIDSRKKGNIPKMIALAVVFLIGFSVFMRTEVASEYMERQTEMSIDYGGGSRSGFMRLWRGYYVYAEMPTRVKIIGLNNDELLQRYEQMSVFSETFGSENDRFYNGMSMLLTKQGLVGLFLFFCLIVCVWKRTTKPGHLLIVCFLSYMLMESVYLNYRMAFYLVIAWGLVSPSLLQSSIEK